MKSGDYFGELALFDNKPRKARVVTLEDCDFATLTKKDYDTVLSEVEKELKYAKINLLKEIPLFKEFTIGKLYLFAFHMKPIYLLKGQLLIKEFDKHL